MRWIFVTGGVVSSLGKGITTASLGRLLRSRGATVTFLKVDPYLNQDAGTLSPHQHGEVYVLDDGTETDLDLGHYERYAGVTLTGRSSATSGQIYRRVLDEERAGNGRGKTIQTVPHVTNEIKRRFADVADDGTDVVLVEIGGTVGDMESMPILEAIRQFRLEHRGSVYLLHMALSPHLDCSDEQKTKPVQHSVRLLQETVGQPDAVLVRSQFPLGGDEQDKLRLYCGCPVFGCPDTSDVYEVPQMLDEAGLLSSVWRHLNLGSVRPAAGISPAIPSAKTDWHTSDVVVALVGKYHRGADSYRSVREAIRHAANALGLHLTVRQVDCDGVVPMDVDAVVLPGGFGDRGIDGMVRILEQSRDRQIPTLGLCLGMQLMAIEAARRTGEDAVSEEFHPGGDCTVVSLIPGLQAGQGGGQLRCGGRSVYLHDQGRLLYANQAHARERFRHRYAVSRRGEQLLTEGGFQICGYSDSLPALIVLPNHPFYWGCQYHPEFCSRPDQPHPLFLNLLKTCSASCSTT